MDSKAFTLDTNILIYVVDRNGGDKRRLAAEILAKAAERDCRLTLQSISVVYSAATRKRIIASDEAAVLANDWLTLFPTIAATPRAIRAAIGHASAGRTSYWDGLLLETAIDGGCGVIISEDMADGASFGGAVIRNPFASGALSAEVDLILS
jgi:predicted nucleic acid-binding protein